MTFSMSQGLINAGKSLHRTVMKISLISARANQFTLDALSTNVGKAALLLIPKYGKAAAFVVEPLRDMHRLALNVHEAIAEGRSPGTLGDYLKANGEVIKRHLPALKEAHREYKAAQASPQPFAYNPA